MLTRAVEQPWNIVLSVIDLSGGLRISPPPPPGRVAQSATGVAARCLAVQMVKELSGCSEAGAIRPGGLPPSVPLLSLTCQICPDEGLILSPSLADGDGTKLAQLGIRPATILQTVGSVSRKHNSERLPGVISAPGNVAR